MARKKSVETRDEDEAGDRNNPRKEIIRDELLTRAAELFDRRGYANTRMQDIAEELGLRRSSLYHYFSTKDDILIALIEKEAQVPALHLAELIADSSLTATARLRAALTGNIMRKLSGGPRFRVLDRTETEMPEALAATYGKAKREVLELYSAIIRTGIERGEFRKVDPRIATFAVIGMSNWTAWWYSPKGRYSPGEIADMITDFAIAALASHSGGDKLTDLDDAISGLNGIADFLGQFAKGR